MSDKAIPRDKFHDYVPRIGAIADAWAYNEGHGRTKIFERLVDHAKRGWLSAEWVDGAYHALLQGKHLEFHYDPKTRTTGWLAGNSPEHVREVLQAAKKNGFKMRSKE